MKKNLLLLLITILSPFLSAGQTPLNLVVNIVQSEAFDFLDSPIKKINSADVPMPYSSFLENKYLPQVDDIVLAIKEVCYI